MHFNLHLVSRAVCLQRMNNDALSVTLLTRIIQETLENEFPFVRVVGEISNYKHHSSGHRYFTLKDDTAQIRCVMWRTRSISMQPSDGLKVVVTGRLSLYPSQGNYQIDCFGMTPAGLGELYVAFEKLKNELRESGYFDEARKKPLPRIPQRIGVATSPTGAAVRDILSTLQQRMPASTVVFRPTLVQGEGSAQDIVRAIAALEAHDCDVIIIGRGGGSIEDLWSFNTRAVADAIYNARTPIISAVGHETDVSIADFVADVRAATPTAAAVLCTPIRADELSFELDRLSDLFGDALEQRLAEYRELLEEWTSGQVTQKVVEVLQSRAENIKRIQHSMTRTVQHATQLVSMRLRSLENTIQVLEPLSPLKRGFALLEKNGHVVANDKQLAPGDRVTIRRQKERAEVVVEVVKEE